MINIGIGISWAKAIYSVANNVIANFKARVLSYPNSIFEAGPCLDATLEELNAIGLLDNASLIITPNAYNAGILYDVIPNTTLGDMDVVRATTATRVNSAGLIEVVPRNLVTYSNDASAQTLNNMTASVNTIISPDGTQNADTITPSAGNSDHFLLTNATETVTTGVSFTASVFVKKKDYDYVHFGTGGNASFGSVAYSFLTNTFFGITVSTYSSVDFGNGWIRLTISGNTLGTDLRIILTPTNSSGERAFNANGIDGLYIYGMQLEQGSTSTEYFPTTTRLNIPRIDYTNGSCPSLLVEPQRTNVQIYSEDFSNAIYLQIGATITTNTNVSPDGNTTADRLTEDTSTGFHTIDILNPPVVAGSYTVSVFVKANGRTKFQILGFYALTGNVDFDLTLGTATTTAPALNGKIENYGNGWYRCQATFTDLTGAGAQILFNILNNAGSNSYTGDGTSGLILWGAQLEAGSYSTSYIPTVASAVTRNADVISKTGISSLIGQTEGTLFWEGYLNPTQTGQLVGIEKNGTDVIRIQKANASSLILAEIYVNGTDYIYRTFTSVVGKNKIALVYKSGATKIYLNGSLIITDTTTYTFSGALNMISINSLWNSSSDNTKSEFNSIQIYKTALSDTEAINLTTL